MRIRRYSTTLQPEEAHIPRRLIICIFRRYFLAESYIPRWFRQRATRILLRHCTAIHPSLPEKSIGCFARTSKCDMPSKLVMGWVAWRHRPMGVEERLRLHKGPMRWQWHIQTDLP